MDAIISYDDTLNDHDALMLGRVLADLGAELTLAYVRHSAVEQPAHEQLEEEEAQALLERGARWLGDLDVERQVVLSASTGEGLRRLAETAEADLVVFGSDYRTAAGHVAPGSSAQTLLEGGRTAVAVAPANYWTDAPREIRTIGVLPYGDEAVLETAEDLADRVGATLVGVTRGVDLLIVGSRPEAPQGRVMISANAGREIENATSPVLVLARATPLSFAVSLV